MAALLTCITRQNVSRRLLSYKKCTDRSCIVLGFCTTCQCFTTKIGTYRYKRLGKNYMAEPYILLCCIFAYMKLFFLANQSSLCYCFIHSYLLLTTFWCVFNIVHRANFRSCTPLKLPFFNFLLTPCRFVRGVLQRSNFRFCRPF